MRITIVGGGPAGLYFALLMKRRDAAHDVVVLERDGPDDTFGWGIVFSDQTFHYLRQNDRESYDAITSACEQWDNVDIVHRGERITVRGNRFSGIARLRFLQILHQRCRDLDVDLVPAERIAQAGAPRRLRDRSPVPWPPVVIEDHFLIQRRKSCVGPLLGHRSPSRGPTKMRPPSTRTG